MVTRSLRSKEWTPTRITTRSVREPRDEQPKRPGSTLRARPKPINLAPGEPCPILMAPLSSRRQSEELNESPQEPEIVDVAAPSTWPRRGPQPCRMVSKGIGSPSVASEKSPRQSEISFGILDYYMDRSPMSSPKVPAVPRIDTPVIDPAMEKFDFGLSTGMPKAPAPQASTRPGREESSLETKTGAEQGQIETVQSTPPARPPRPQAETKNSYRLFPRVPETTPPSKGTLADRDSPSPQDPTTAGTISFVPSHSQPDASYRPRKESMSGSVRSRKDSFTSFCGTRRIPMRILSCSAASKPHSDRSNISGTSPPQQSRWSDESNITSPLAATTPGPRTSFGSLLGRDSAQYPACFFEDDDDDEVMPLRRKLGWKRSTRLTHERKVRKAERFGEHHESFGRRVGRVLLCGGCYGER